jgi:hypothetical protein
MQFKCRIRNVPECSDAGGYLIHPVGLNNLFRGVPVIAAIRKRLDE